MKKSQNEIKFEFLNDVSKMGTPLKYIKFADSTLRLTEEQKETLKRICQGYFFYSKAKRMWGFTHKGDNEVNVSAFLKFSTIPVEINSHQNSSEIEIRKDQIPFSLNDFEIKYVELKGRPLFYHENTEGIIEIHINLAHWFFEKRDSAEKEIVRKIVLSLVGTELEFTSQLIDSFFIKLNSIQENMKYNYEKH
jgi:hypothetical protein